MKSKQFTVLGICGAQGALLFPLRDHLIGNVEPRGVFHTPKEEQWRANFDRIPFERDLSKFEKARVDVIIGSPNCGHSSVFSYSRKKTLGKPREDASLNLFVESIKKFNPQIFLCENLPKLLDMIPLENWELLLPRYSFIVHCDSVMAWGNSQKSRKRMLLIGVRKDCKRYKNLFEEVFRVAKPLKVGELSKKVRKELNYRENPDKVLAMYDSRKPGKKNLTVEEVRKLWKTDFRDEKKWPMPGTKMKTLPGVYRNRRDEYPMTVRPSSRQFNPKGKIMGLDEYRVIMGFPENFKIHFEEKRRGYWLNKGRVTLTKGAVYEMGVWFQQCLGKSF
jgi:site-specific DNA-cytosine methylase|uniref:Cytosine DNA methyltransferase n=1 Tax=Myoviridae sp. ct3Pt8 TaxID=2826608 RepID=A0A8S5MMB8_9CAUD|nr:MAG TPA: cytosine DNA methyltransferase [Myoviridae sp. ct3Pt8]